MVSHKFCIRALLAHAFHDHTKQFYPEIPLEGVMIAQDFEFTGDLRIEQYPGVLSIEENLLWIQKTSEGASANGISGFYGVQTKLMFF
jgi:hypothetical protein